MIQKASSWMEAGMKKSVINYVNLNADIWKSEVMRSTINVFDE